MDRFDALVAFRAVVDAGGFSAAARRLGTSKAAISSRIARLEDHLGVVLLNRTTRRLSLTEAGRAFYGESVRILDLLADAEADMSAAHAQARGLLKINAPLTFATRRLVPLVARYMTSHPQVRVDLQLHDGPVDPVGEGFDITLRITRRLDDSQVVSRRLGAIAHAVCASPAYIERHGAPHRPQDLRSHSLIVYGVGGTDLIRYTFQSPRGDSIDLEISPRLSVNNSMAIAEAVQAGAGVAVMPRFAADAALLDGRLVEVMPGYAVEPYGLFALLPAGRKSPAKTRSFLNLLVEEERTLCDTVE